MTFEEFQEEQDLRALTEHQENGYARLQYRERLAASPRPAPLPVSVTVDRVKNSELSANPISR